MKRLTGTLTARGDDNQIYTIHEFTDFEVTRPPDRDAYVMPGLEDLLTSDGESVRWKERSVFEIVATGVILRIDT